LLVIRDVFAGKGTYGEFQASPESIPTNILADRLKRLVRYGVLQKIPYQQRPVRYTYQLTDKGHSLAPVIREILQWGTKNIAGTAANIKMNL
jgi:DNA-binding HxlR family transcriptional regulator